MHPNPAYRVDDREQMESLVEQVGFGMIFATTPDGPRVAHTPLISDGEGRIRFHLSRGNSMTRHLDGMTALAVVNGPDAYVSARWYEDETQVPTWDYVSAEIEGTVSHMDKHGLRDLLEALSARHEARISGGKPWTMDKTPPEKLARMFGAIVGFEMTIETVRHTAKLHQKAPQHERDRVIAGLEAHGSGDLANLMRQVGK